MSMEKSEKQISQSVKKQEDLPLLSWDNLFIIINTLQHGMIAIVCFYTTWYCIQSGFSGHTSLHTWLCTLGYQLLMVEGIMVFYKQNSYTFLIKKRDHKNWLHTLLLVLGSGLAIAGTMVEWNFRQARGRHSWNHRHCVWGIASVFMLAPTILSGTLSLFPQPFKRCLKPLLSKATHNLFAVGAFATGMVSIWLAWEGERWARSKDPGNIRHSMAWMTAITTVIACFGPAKTAFNQVRTALNF